MCLGHVYIVLKPVGSARLTFDDDLYYELCDLMTEDCSSPGGAHGHDEESRNGREVKIDILEGYIRTSERFRVIRLFFESTGELREFAGRSIGLIRPYVNRGGRPKGRRRAPPHGSELD